MRPFDSVLHQPIMLWFTFRFDNLGNMAEFASSLLDKPFVLVLGKILDDDALVAQIYLPTVEFRQFIDCLSQLCRSKLLQSYHYVIQDRRRGKWSRETIPFEEFRDGKWVYDQKRDIEKLYDLVEKNQKTS